MSNCTTVSGSNLAVRVKEESEFGISEAAGFKTVYVKSNSINFSQNEVESELLTAGRSPSKTGKGNIEVSGSIEVAVDADQTGFWLKMLTGVVKTITDFVPGKQKHTFTISDQCLPSFQIEKSLIGSDVNYKSVGLKANSFGLEFGGEGELIASVDVIGKNEFFTPIQSDSNQGIFNADYAINTKNITLVDATGFEAGDTVTIEVLKASVASSVAKGLSVVELQTGEGASFTSGDYVSLDEVNSAIYQVKAISGDKIYLSRGVEHDIAANTIVFNSGETNKIVSVTGNDIVLVNGLKQAVIAANDFIQSSSKAAIFNGKTFENFEVDITSVDGAVLTGSIETLSFSYSNNSEGKVLLADKGTVGRIIDGSVKIECDLSILFDAANARFIEEAKIGKEFDIKLSAVNSDGDSLTITMPKGTLTPQTPEISSPTAISVSLKYMPFKTATTEAITFELINTIASY